MSSNAANPMPRKKSDPKRPDAVDVTVGINLRIWRIARGLSQADLAKRLGITFQQVQKYEIGHNRISTGRLAKAAVILRVPMSALFHGADAEDPTQALLADNRAFRLAQAFATLKNTNLRLRLVALVENIAALAPEKKRRTR
jgi:transcriptional regulator with XRE-family HTH domain